MMTSLSLSFAFVATFVVVAHASFSCQSPTAFAPGVQRTQCAWLAKGQPTCYDFATLLPESVVHTSSSYGKRIDAPATTDPSGSVTLTLPAALVGGDYDRILGFTADYGVNMVASKAGSGSAVANGAFYIYKLDSLATTVSLGVSAVEDKDISHIDFCGPSGPSAGPTTAGPSVPTCPLTCGAARSAPSCAALTSPGQCYALGACPDSHHCEQDGDHVCGYAVTLLPSSTVCRSSTGVCDPAEKCTGADRECPIDALSSSTQTCRASSGPCDEVEQCDGVSPDCPADLFKASDVQCRASSGVCDVEETCTGTGPACPDDVFKPSDVLCRGSAGICDVEETCTGTGPFCPADSFKSSTVQCRGSAGVCDVEETCTGNDAACPADVLKASTVQCRDSAGVCDVVESCTGTDPSCPADVFKPSDVQCRASAGVCDVEESCPGTGPACPANAFKPSGVQCRASAGVCDVEEVCPGSGPVCPVDAFQPSTVVCRAKDDSAGSCDKTEFCPGNAVQCPADGGLSTGIVFKCGLEHFLTGGIDSNDLFSIGGSKYLAGNTACNIGANKKTTEALEPAGQDWDANGCAPATCPNGKALSNAVFGSCVNQNGWWRWSCTGKKETGSPVTQLCPAATKRAFFPPPPQREAKKGKRFASK